ncbi:MAG: signal peptidase I, partial [Acidimicrobiia bacterium]
MGRDKSRRRDGARFLAGVSALFVLSLACFLAAFVVIPRVAFGWVPVAITSGSMAPSLEQGDIVLASPHDGVGLVPGTVVVFRGPEPSGYVTHRVSSVSPSGSYVTKGDASLESDSTPLEPENVVGVGTLLVPFGGVPLTWLAAGNHLAIGAALVGLFASGWMARWAFLADPWRARSRETPNRTARTAPTMGLVLLLVVGGSDLSRAAFADSASNATNTLTGAATFSVNSFRVTTYELGDGVFTGVSHTLTLNQNLATDYFVLLRGAAGANDNSTNRNPDQTYARVSGDPHGNLAAVTAADQLQLSRSTAASAWQGQVTVVESIADQENSGFRLLDVVEVTMGAGVVTDLQSASTPWSDINQVGLYGGVRGGGVSTTTAVRSDHMTAWARIYPTGASNVVLERQAGGGGSLSGSTVFSIYAVEWGSEWAIQRATVAGTSGGNGANLLGHYDVAAIAPVLRSNTFVLGYGTSTDNGLGDGWEGQVFTLGDGVNQLATETNVAVGGEYPDARTAEVYVHSHPS